VNQSFREFYTKTHSQPHPDSHYYRYGSDLDGVFLPDIPDRLYQEHLEAALHQRHQLAPFDASLFPPKGHEDWIIVTGRPLVDESVTHEWLSQHGIPYQSLKMRDTALIDFSAGDDHYTKAEKSAQAKADHIRAEGISHFYESDPLQATLLASWLPMVRIFWWNNNAAPIRQRIMAHDPQLG
jgi:hypothetical protein